MDKQTRADRVAILSRVYPDLTLFWLEWLDATALAITESQDAAKDTEFERAYREAQERVRA